MLTRAYTYLARVLASLQVSSAEHGVGDHARVGVVTVLIREDGKVQALQLVAANSCESNRFGVEIGLNGRKVKDGIFVIDNLFTIRVPLFNCGTELTI